MENNKFLVLYDGHCNFCVAVVNFLEKKDKRGVLEYMPLQKKEARAVLREKDVAFVSLKTIYLVAGNNVYKRSRAIFTIFQQLPFPWKILSVLKVLPVFLTDAGYKLVAKYRYSIFGKRDELHEPVSKSVV